MFILKICPGVISSNPRFQKSQGGTGIKKAEKWEQGKEGQTDWTGKETDWMVEEKRGFARHKSPTRQNPESATA